MYYVQRWPRAALYHPDICQTVASHENKEVAKLLVQCLPHLGGEYQVRLISENALKREGKAVLAQALEGLIENKDTQELLWQTMRSASKLDPLHSAKSALEDLQIMQIRAEDEIHQKVSAGHSFREIGLAVDLSHERVRQIYQEADNRLKQMQASCANGHIWMVYKYSQGILPEECPTCEEIFTGIIDPQEKPLPASDTVDLVPIKDVVPEDNKDQDYAFGINKDGSSFRVIQVTPLQFDMKTEQERESMLNIWAEMLDGLDFPIQIISHNRKLDPDEYLKKLDENKPDLTFAFEGFGEDAQKITGNIPARSLKQARETLQVRNITITKLTQLAGTNVEKLKKNLIKNTETAATGNFIARDMYLVICIGKGVDMKQLAEKPNIFGSFVDLILRKPDDAPVEIDPQKLALAGEMVQFFLKRMDLKFKDLNYDELVELMTKIMRGK